MHLQYLVAPVLVALVDAAALQSGSKKTKAASTTYTGPDTISNTASAISSVLSVMSAASPKSTNDATVTVTVSPTTATSTIVIKPSTTKSVSKGPKTTSKKKSTTKKATTKPTKHTTKKPTKPKTTKSVKHTTGKPAKQTSKKSNKASHKARDVIATQVKDVKPACETEPSSGFAYVPSPNTDVGFLNDTTLHNSAMTVATPSGFRALYAGYYGSLSIKGGGGYNGFTQMSSYNPSECANHCLNDFVACRFFTIYYERDPTAKPGVSCPNPDAQVSIKCAYYTTSIKTSYVTNVGEWRNSFAVLITGANGYTLGS